MMEPTLARRVTKLTSSDPSAYDAFGRAVAISGDIAVVGATLDDQRVMITGAAYVFVRTAEGWSPQAKLKASDPGRLDGFGAAVAVSGDTVVVGVPFSEPRRLRAEPLSNNYVGTPPNDHGGPNNNGSAYVFVQSGSEWRQMAKLVASDSADGDVFGLSVAVSGDTAVVGAYRDDHSGRQDAGAAYIFVRNGNRWFQEAKLTASDPAPYHNFGSRVAISGDIAVVGVRLDDARGTNAGAAYIFVRNGTSWFQEAKLAASDAMSFNYFGTSVAISGDTAVIGASSNNGRGAAYVFIRSGDMWFEEAKLIASDARFGDRFGSSAAISGDIAVVGADLDDHSGSKDAGSAYVFVRNGNSWFQQVKLTPSGLKREDLFGISVGVSNDTAIAGVIRSRTTEREPSAAYIFDSRQRSVCHLLPSNSDDARTIFVDSSALSGHLAHGDTIGACP